MPTRKFCTPLLACLATLSCARAYLPPDAGAPRATLEVSPTRWGDTIDDLPGGSFESLQLEIFGHEEACTEGSELGLRDIYLGEIALTLSRPRIEIPADQEVVLALTHTTFATYGFGTCRARLSFRPAGGARYTLDADFLFERRCVVSVLDAEGAKVPVRRVTECFPDAEDPSGLYRVGFD